MLFRSGFTSNLDLSAVLIHEEFKIYDFVYFSHDSKCGAIKLSRDVFEGHKGTKEEYMDIDLTKLPQDIKSVVIIISDQKLSGFAAHDMRWYIN